MKKLCIVILMLVSTSVICSASIIVSGGHDNDIAGRMCRTPTGRLIAIVERNSDWGSGNFFACFSDNDGATWSTLDTVVFQSGNQSTHSVVCANNTVYLFYASDESGSYKIYSIESVDGISWSNKTLINFGWMSSQSVYDPIVIAEDDGSLTMSYISMSNGAYAAHCPVSGTWDINKNQIMSGSYRARICKHPNGTYMAAYHRNISGNYDIHVRTSTDLVNWTSEIDITSNGNSHDAYCAVSPDSVYYLYYAKNTSGVYNLCRKSSTDCVNWSSEDIITSDLTSNTQASIFFDNNLLHLMWTHAIDYNTNNDVYYENYSYATSIENLHCSLDIRLDAFSYKHNLVVHLEGINNEKCKISIFTSNGQLVHEKFLPENESSIILSNIPSGLYIIRAESATYSKTLKTIVN
jgi:BNR repeat-like domain/Secretion system C-terminal sorting domain